MQRDKENVIGELLSVKGENQNLYLQLQQKQNEISNLNQLITEHKKQHTIIIHTIKAELNELKQQYDAEKAKGSEQLKTISSLKKDNQLLSAEVKQLQAPRNISKISKTATTSDSDSEYEVETILSHKIVRKQRKFWVRWKGYPESHNSWVQEKDLKCPLILKKYLKQNINKQ